MMRLLLLCLLLPTATAFSEDGEDINGSGNDPDDEDLLNLPVTGTPKIIGKVTGEEGESDQMTTIVIIVAVALMALLVAAVIAIFLIRRHMHKQQQGIYTVPMDQDKKEAV